MTMFFQDVFAPLLGKEKTFSIYTCVTMNDLYFIILEQHYIRYCR